MQLLNGDCLALLPLVPTASVDLILCDLPYGTTACSWDRVIPFDRLWAEYRRVLKPNGAAVLTASQPFTTELIASNLKDFRYCWVWRKEQGTGFLNAKKQPLKNHEDVAVFYKKPPTYNPQFTAGKPYRQKQGGGSEVYKNEQKGVLTDNAGSRFPLTVIDFPRDKEKVHPTQKPVALMEYLIRTYTNEGDTVLDNTMGSGTTGVAAVKTNRNFIGMELDATHFAIASARIFDAFGEAKTC